MTRDTWEGAILGAVLGSLVIPGVLWLIDRIAHWWRDSRPARQLFGGIADEAEHCKIFVRDFLIGAGTELISVEPRVGIGVVPNVQHLWPDVEGRAVGGLFNVLGQIGKTRRIEIVRMSEDAGEGIAMSLSSARSPTSHTTSTSTLRTSRFEWTAIRYTRMRLETS
jgi:hypothetical protein